MAYIEAAFGREIIDEARDALDDADRRIIDELMPISWLPVDTVERFKGHIARRLGRDPFEFNRHVVHESLGRTITSVWRVLARSLWDAAIVKRTPILYSKTFDRGSLTLVEMDNGRARLVLDGWPSAPDYDCVGLAAGIEAFLQYTGRGNTTVRWHRDGQQVVFEARWAR